MTKRITETVHPRPRHLQTIMRNKQLQVTCIQCHQKGALSLNQYKSNGRTYKYYGIQHYSPETKKRR